MEFESRLALLRMRKGYPETDILFLIVRALPGGNIEVYASLRSLQSERPVDVLQRLALFFFGAEALILHNVINFSKEQKS